MRDPLRPETYIRLSQHEPTRPSTTDDTVGVLRSEISRLAGEIETQAAQFEAAEGTEAGLKIAQSLKVKTDTQARMVARLTELMGGE